jgi:uncharacterized repeat protein (TIGR03803 family)
MQSTVQVSRTGSRVIITALAVAMVLAPTLAATPAAQAQTVDVLYSFQGPPDGSDPCAPLVRDAAGNLYSTTDSGGTGDCGSGRNSGCGTVFKLTRTGKESVLYSFTGTGGDGEYTQAGLVRDGAGNLYGTNQIGGDLSGCRGYGCGTVFKVDKTGNETVLYSFTGSGGDGANPNAVIRDSAGNLYGTTLNGGGASDEGTVFKLDKIGKETVLYRFKGGTDGAGPYAGLVRDPNGNLYGTTYYGGGSGCDGRGCGTVFRLDKTGKETILHSFSNGSDGVFPYAGLIRDASGNLYGTTAGGGSGSNGTVFKLDKTGKETILYAFTGYPYDGGEPNGGLVRDASGNLYGTTTLGGGADYGTVFGLDKTGNEIWLYTFTGGTDGAYPFAGLVQDSKGNLYGTTSGGGSDYGLVFELTP